MNKKIYITIITIITVAAVITGLYIHVMSRSFGRFMGVMRNSSGNAEDTVQLEGQISDISIDLDFSRIIIEYGNEAGVEYSFPQEQVPKITLTNGALKVEGAKNVRLPLFSINGAGSYIRIVVPEGTSLDEIIIHNDAGDLDINSVAAENISIDIDAGNVEIGYVTAKKLDIDVDAGNIEITDSSLEELDVDADAGNLSLRNSSIESLYADIDAGNIETDNCDIVEGSCSASLGNIILHGNIGNVSTKVSLGNVESD